MNPVKFKESNKELSKPSDMTDKECKSLPVYTDGKRCISCWRPSLKEWFSFLLFRKIWLYVHSGVTQSPVAVIAERTCFEKERNENTVQIQE